MTNFVEVIQACEHANGAGTKKIIQAALKTADPIAQRLISEAMNPYRVFGVRKFDMPTWGARCMMSQVNYDEFFDVLDKLALRKLTGDAAREAVTNAIGCFPISAQEYIARIFDKDLKAGFSADTFNKVHPDNPIPSYDVMLAEKCESAEDFEEHIKFPCQADFKYDGERTEAFVETGTVIYRSRSGKEADHVQGLFDEEFQILREELGYDFVADGERCSDKGFTDTVNAKKAGNDEAKANLRFRLFFIMPLSDWLARKTTITMRQNRKACEELLKKTGVKKIILSEGREVSDYHDMMNFCNEAIDKPENAARKIEGLILKDWDAVYEWDRTYSWTKVKRFYDVDAKIVGFYPGRPKSRLATTVGGVNCVAFLENGERVEFNVGSGFSDKDREDMKKNPNKWLAGVHVIKYQEVSRSKSKTVASLRFCTYERSRDDKIVEI